MKLANTIFAIGIGVYYVIGIRTSLLWADYYYAILFGYILSLIIKSSMKQPHKGFAIGISTTIWGFYMLKQFLNIVTADWIRWVLGFVFGIIAILYYFLTPKENED